MAIAILNPKLPSFPQGYDHAEAEGIDAILQERLDPDSVFRNGLDDSLHAMIFAEPEEAPLKWRSLRETVDAVAGLDPAVVQAANQAAATARNELEAVEEDLNGRDIRELLDRVINPAKETGSQAPDGAAQGISEICGSLDQLIRDLLEELNHARELQDDFRSTEAWLMIEETAPEAAAWHEVRRSFR